MALLLLDLAATLGDDLGDFDLGADGVDGDQCPGQFQTLQQKRDGDNLVGFVGDRLLSQHQALAGEGMPLSKGKNRLRKSSRSLPHRTISTKSSIPASVAHSMSSRTSGNG